MNLIIKSLTIENFKGIRAQTINFTNKTMICGQNGAGKTSIADAFFWLFLDKNYNLASNPSIRPNDCDDAIVPTVTAQLEIDGKPVSVSKSQKLKRSKPDEDGITKVSLTNSYLVNDVPKSERDFKAYMEELGVDFEKFAQFSHPDVFVSGIGDKKSREAMRNTLFSMAQSMEDAEIAQMLSNTQEVAQLLQSYKAEEVEAMQNATLRKIKENYGKDGEILRAKIEGLEAAKVSVDIAEMELAKNALNEQIAVVDKQIKSASGDTSVFEQENLQLQFDMNTIKQKMNQEIIEKRRELDEQIYAKEREEKDAKDRLSTLQRDRERLVSERESINKEITELKPKYAELKAMQFDERAKTCPYCKQMLPDDRIQAAIAEFETHKAAEIKKQADYGNGLAKRGFEIDAILDGYVTQGEQMNATILEISEAIEALKKELATIPTSANYIVNPEFQAIELKIAENTRKIAEIKASGDNSSALELKKAILQTELERVMGEIGKASHNDSINAQIAELHKAQIEYEQAKADAEKILFQLSLVSQKKNELLEESVNKHFELVRFKLFDYLKNGSVFDTCIPLIDGFEFGKSTNTGREELAKLDIIKGLQKFFEQSYPVFLDGAEALSSVTASRIDMPCQLVMLTVTEDKELQIS